MSLKFVHCCPIEYDISNESIWSTDATLTHTATSDQSGTGSNGNEGVFYTFQISWNGASQSDVA